MRTNCIQTITPTSWELAKHALQHQPIAFEQYINFSNYGVLPEAVAANSTDTHTPTHWHSLILPLVTYRFSFLLSFEPKMNITDIESDADLPVNEPNVIHIRFLLWKIQGKAYKTAYLTFTFVSNLNNKCRMPIMVT